MDLTDADLWFRFGTINDRPVKAAEVTKLVASFMSTGIARWDDQNAIPVAYSSISMRSAMAVKTLLPDPMQYPQLKFMFNKDTLTEVSPYGGQHRYHAIRRILQEAEIFVAQSEANSTTLSKALHDAETALHNNNNKRDHKTLRGRVANRRAELEKHSQLAKIYHKIIADGGHWLVKIYATGE